MSYNLLFIYVFPLLFVSVVYALYRRQREQKNLALQKDEFDAGLIEPPSLHPRIDPAKCLGCGACVTACPEQTVLGLIDGKAQLIAPTRCIGHGACKTACPFDAISLVFGTEKRGMDIPFVQPNFETNVPGIFIAGELGGMGLIRNAVEQGRQAMDAISGKLRQALKAEGIYDVVIIGAGPAGFSASLAAIAHKLNYLTLEQESFGGMVAHYPRGKVVMTQPAELPLIGKMDFREISKEGLLEFWQKARARAGVRISFNEQVERIFKEDDHWVIKTFKGEYKARAVLLAIGRRGTPRKLGVPGEEKSKVVYRLIDPQQYRSMQVLVVGGGDSALEAAASLVDVEKTTVTLSYRGDAFGRARQKNREKVQAASRDGRLKSILRSNVKEIRDREVVLEQEGRELIVPNDAVIVCAGGILPAVFLKETGVEVETKYGTA
ncbi:MAG: NAD(P)-binding domain-containing protein [Candidatus Omnitrophica bacterium]|nr:NAD(P)-binding domain-containing protein [Candidatus Omnitrophota bacterium]